MKSKNLKQKIHHAKEGNLLSQFELFQYFEKNSDQVFAQEYFSMCLSSINKYPLRVQSMRLTDFRRFTNFEIKFSGSLTVLIGENGSGKSTVLEAISKNLSWLLGNLLKEDRTGRSLIESDVNVNSFLKLAESHLVLFFSSKSEYESLLVKNLPGNKTSKDSILESIRSLGDMYRVLNARKEINLPLMMYYSVNRTNETLQNTYGEKDFDKPKLRTRFSAFNNALNGKAGVADFSEWFLSLSNLVESEEKNSKRIELQEELEILYVLCDNSDNPDQQATLESLISQKERSLNELKQGLREGYKFTSQLELIKSAIAELLPGFSDIYVDRSSGKAAIHVEMDNTSMHINQLSDGQRIILGLGADLARRLILLNPVIGELEEGTPLYGQGVVLIDEVELHLHPKWQQSILLNLTKVFKNIQFIVTTHSPQVLSTVDKHDIRIFDEEKVTEPIFQTKGVMSSDILERIMRTFSVPQIPITEKLNQLGGLIEEDRYETDGANSLWNDLRKHFGNDHPEIIKLEKQVKLVELKRKVKTLKKGDNS